MPRNIVVANGKLCVALDRNMSIRDLFYPQVGLENHAAGHEFKTGVWVDGHFSWFGKDWTPDMKYMPDTLVSRCMAMSPSMSMRCEINDAIHPLFDIFMRKFTLQNIGTETRKVRLFFAHDFHVYGDAVGDTVMYESASKAIL